MIRSIAAGDTLARARQIRNDALSGAQRERALGTHQADLEYSATVAKLRERFEADLAEAAVRHREAVRPVHRAFNTAVIEAEQAYAAAVRDDLPFEVDVHVVPTLAGVDIISVRAS
jgi:hypothetical protein